MSISKEERLQLIKAAHQRWLANQAKRDAAAQRWRQLAEVDDRLEQLERYGEEEAA